MIKLNKIYVATRPGVDGSFKSVLATIKMYTLKQQLTFVERVIEVDKDTLVIALGGDGTMLHACKIGLIYDAHVLGINFGYRGFLVNDYEEEDINQLLDDIFINEMGGLKVIKRDVLISKIGNPIQTVYALNEFQVAPITSGSSIDVEVRIDGNEVLSFRGSGLVVSTPTGSTAFALSAGGAIIDPNTRAIEITPLLPHTLSARPLIIPNSGEVEVFWTNNTGQVYADGQFIEDGEYGMNSILIKKATKQSKMIKSLNWNYYSNLKEKMSWYK